MKKINLHKYCNLLIDILSIEPAGYILVSKSVLPDSLSSLQIKKLDLLVEYNTNIYLSVVQVQHSIQHPLPLSKHYLSCFC